MARSCSSASPMVCGIEAVEPAGRGQRDGVVVDHEFLGQRGEAERRGEAGAEAQRRAVGVDGLQGGGGQRFGLAGGERGQADVDGGGVDIVIEGVDLQVVHGDAGDQGAGHDERSYQLAVHVSASPS